MTILQRCTLKQFIPPFFLAIIILTFVLLMDRLFLLADLLVRKGVPVVIVAEIMVMSLPFVVSICAPLGSLIAGVVSFGRMAQDNEVRVIRAAGIRLVRVFAPTALACVVLLVVMTGFNGYVVPEAQHRVRNLLTDVARKRPAMRIREGVFMDDFPGYMIYIGSIDERRSKVKNVAIFESKPRQGAPSFVTAPEGDITYTSDDRYMVLTLLNGEMHELSDDQNYRRITFERHVINVQMDEEFIRRDREYRSDEEMALPRILRQVKQLDHEALDLQQQTRKSAALADTSEPEKLRLNELQTRLRYKRLESARYRVELNKRLSVAFSAFFFLLFGAPVGLLLRRGGIGTGFIVGLAFFALYYVLLLAGQNFADAGKLSPFVGMWLPNIILVLPVTELFSRAFFERPVFLRFGTRR